MNKPLDLTQLNAINTMSAEQRYDYTIQQLIVQQEVWGLSSPTGWLVLPDEGEEHLPIWPHAQLASAWAADDFSDCQPKLIPLEDWLEKWLPGMTEDGLLAAVCPTADGDSIIVAADELLINIHEADGE